MENVTILIIAKVKITIFQISLDNIKTDFRL